MITNRSSPNRLLLPILLLACLPLYAAEDPSSPKGFDAAGFPKLSFESTSITRKSDVAYVVTGDMTIRGTKRKISLDVRYNGTVKGIDGDVAAFEITGNVRQCRQVNMIWPPADFS